MTPPFPASAAPRSLPAPAETLCLDFANTLAWRGSTPPEESLNGPADLLAWMARAGLPGGDAAGLHWHAAPEAAAPAFRQAIDLRETIYRVLAGEGPDAGDPGPLDAALRQIPPRRTLLRTADGLGWRAEGWTPTLPCLLAPVLWSAADLLAGPRHGLLRRCANPQCGWLFIDDSRSGNRRWCSMASCGNRAKARRHYERSKERRVEAG